MYTSQEAWTPEQYDLKKNSQPWAPETPEEYYQSIVDSPAVLGKRSKNIYSYVYIGTHTDRHRQTHPHQITHPRTHAHPPTCATTHTHTHPHNHAHSTPTNPTHHSLTTHPAITHSPTLSETLSLTHTYVAVRY